MDWWGRATLSRSARTACAKRSHAHTRLAVAVVSLAAVGALVTGCSRGTPSNVAAPPSQPGAANLSSPQAAVRSYLDWSSFAYRMGDSDLASETASPDEEVRVDSYIELLKEKGRGIEQHLTSFSIVRSSAEGTHTLVATHETWSYRYLAPDGRTYLTPAYSTSYDATYTVVRQPDGRWAVDSVDATPLGTVH